MLALMRGGHNVSILLRAKELCAGLLLMSDEELIEMDGVFVAWDGRRGIIHADGAFIPLDQFSLRCFGFRHTPKVGDRIRFMARRDVELTYTLEDVRLIVPQEPRMADALAFKAWRGKDGLQVVEHEGVVESFDRQKGFGFIQCADGEKVLVHVTVLRASGFKDLVAGARITFSMLRRPKGLQAFRIHKIDAPA